LLSPESQEDRMSQRSVERALGKMVTDEAFRADFFLDPWRASVIAGLDLLAYEVEALLKVPRSLLDRLSADLDDRICRLCIVDRNPEERARS
jgi:hypothetical protein